MGEGVAPAGVGDGVGEGVAPAGAGDAVGDIVLTNVQNPEENMFSISDGYRRLNTEYFQNTEYFPGIPSISRNTEYFREIPKISRKCSVFPWKY